MRPTDLCSSWSHGLDTLARGVATVHETYDGRTPTPQTGSVDPLVTELIEAVQID
jgi:hypothetical protein